MFLDNHHIPRGTVNYKTYTPGARLPILSSAALLHSVRHKALLKQLAMLIDIDADDYEYFYQSTIERFAAFVQVLPMQPSGPLSGILNEGLARAYLAVKAYREQAKSSSPLMLYAVFSAALLMRISQTMVNQLIVFANDEGDYLGDWLPFTGPMINQADFYKLYAVGPTYQRLDTTLTPMLAEVILPREGFLWLSSDFTVFAEWLDVLRGDSITGGRVAYILSLIPQDELMELINNLLIHMDIDLFKSPATEYGDLFLEWLRDGIQSGEIEINSAEAGVHTVADGVFLEQNKIFHQFVEATRLPVNINVVFQQFGNLFGIASKGGGDYLNRQYFSKYPQAGQGFRNPFGDQQKSMRQGMVVSNAGLVFKSGQAPVATDKLIATRSSQIVAHQLPNRAQAGMQHGSKR
jgi:hypothetical protein